MRVTLRPMGSAPAPPPPENILIPERLAVLADRLKGAIATIEEWGISLDPTRRHDRSDHILL